MMKKSFLSPFYYYVFCVMAYFLGVFINEIFIQQGFEAMGLSSGEYKEVEVYKFAGYMIGSFFLLFFIQSFAAWKMMILSVFLYWISVFNIIFIDVSYDITLLYVPIYSATIIVVSNLLLGYFLSDRKMSNNYSVFIYASSILVSYLISEFFRYIKFDYSNNAWMTLIILNIIFISLFALNFILSKLSSHKINLEEYRFLPVLKHSELEILTAFCVLYCIMVMQYGYNFYAASDSLFTFAPATKKYFRLIAVAVAMVLVFFYMGNKKRHEVNISCIIILMLLFVSINIWGKFSIFTIFGRGSLIIAAYVLLVNSLLLIAEKFRGMNLFNALSLYFTGAVLGSYCGYKTIGISEKSLGVNGFLISICFVLLGLLLYYLYSFKKYKLYR